MAGLGELLKKSNPNYVDYSLRNSYNIQINGMPLASRAIERSRNARNVTEEIALARQLGIQGNMGYNMAAMQNLAQDREKEEQRLKAERQSLTSKLGNAILQTGSEFVLGTLSGLFRTADLVVWAYDGLMGNQYDFKNFVADEIDSWNEALRNDIAPVYTNGSTCLRLSLAT